MHIVRDPLWKDIAVNDSLFQAAKTAPFTRLMRIKQLGPTETVYPGASHTRASHSFGVYHLACRLADKLYRSGASQWMTAQGRASFEAAALFHDLGHFPFTHALKELPLRDHESLTADAVRTPETALLIEQSGGDAEQTAAIVDTSLSTSDIETLFYRKLLSGVLDPDKLDYLNRDAYYCGVPYGVQDTDYILSRLQPDKERGIVIDSSLILSVENVLFSKYLMYRAVYWHKNVRIATAMMKKILFNALEKRIIVPEELYHLDDAGLHILLAQRGCLIGESVPDNRGSISAPPFSNQLFTVIAEFPFDSKNEMHQKLENLHNRTSFENMMAEKAQIQPNQFLIDIPERISFETDLYVFDEHTSFPNSSTVFSPATVASFTQSLRKIRIAVSPSAVSNIPRNFIEDLGMLGYNQALKM